MEVNEVKAVLKRGGTVVGSEASRFGSPELARIFAAAGFDFIFIDMEHTHFGLETVANIVSVARLVDITPIVRVPNAEYHLIARALDAGAMGIILPRLEEVDEVERAVGWIRYPPKGRRGVALTPSQTEYRQVSVAEFLDWIEKEILVVVQIERKRALENLDGILSVEGVDVAALGWTDLSVDLGCPGEIGHPLIQEAIESVIDASNRRGIAPGMIAADLETLSYWSRRGARFLSYSCDGMMLLDAAKTAVNHLRPADRLTGGEA
jgi:2-keto-3-deoxy-L-rhamnonate aldolase RhmA